MQQERLKFINLYKIIAALIISCFLHYDLIFLPYLGKTFEGNSQFLKFLMANTSNYLVEFFYVISGMLFVFAYLEKIDLRQLVFRDFIDKRLRRLLPLTIITTFVMFFLQILCKAFLGVPFYPGEINVDSLIRAFFLLGSTILKVRVNAPAWYVFDLIICYIIAFLLTKHRKKIGIITYFLPIIVGCIIQETGLNFPLLEFHASRAYIAFFTGVILGILIPLFSLNKNITPIILGVVLIILPLSLRAYVKDWSIVSSCMVFPGVILIGYFTKIFNKISDNAVVTYLGVISFDIYLWNFPILVVYALLSRFLIVNTRIFLVELTITHLIVGMISNKCMKKVDKSINVLWLRGSKLLLGIKEK